jgi:hypothetical protein
MGRLGEEFKYHPVRWSKVCMPISKGGLRIWNLLSVNHALLGKWLWRYGLEGEAWWRVVVGSKYGSSCVCVGGGGGGGGCSNELIGLYGGGFMEEYYEGLRKFCSRT